MKFIDPNSDVDVREETPVDTAVAVRVAVNRFTAAKFVFRCKAVER